MFKRNLLKKGMIGLGILSFLFSVTGCFYEKGEENVEVNITEEAVIEDKKMLENESDISSFTYGQNGMMINNNYSYDIHTLKDGKVLFTYSSAKYSEFGEFTKEVDSSFIDKLNELYKTYQLFSWESNSQSDMLDGSGFYVAIEFNDGEAMYVSCTNSFPEDYEGFKKQTEELFKPLVNEFHDGIKLEVIEKGVNSKLDNFLVRFEQRGISGKDKYYIKISKQTNQTNNCIVEIQSYSEEFLPKGEYIIKKSVSDKEIDFEGIQGLIEKYELINWYDYDEDVDDYNNTEIFQVNFSYKGDYNYFISATGTKHPKNYDEFRKEFLELMAESVLKEKD